MASVFDSGFQAEVTVMFLTVCVLIVPVVVPLCASLELLPRSDTSSRASPSPRWAGFTLG